MSATLSTHVLDTAHGRPAAGIAVTLLDGDAMRLFDGVTNADGRCPALAAVPVSPGRHALCFAVADYFRAAGVELPDPPFLDRVTIDFGIAPEGGHYHVPLLVSPYSYSTYRGS
ncbi:5-hydroxyisourate hydrolase [Sphingomonas sp. SORGH_AS870]|uniref:hydroxyisourate hydrolase n=1 Tax=Sphingomonas sp. SORGH_AS_0870 TaxID=3041801 RepID=UPI0028594889|nr:hydroxyisourate hydrolase [Sphingomonas sp. SORGH_AS_0870]MDR6147410.1 5-hydroxyisourate hydrolase [Sphingomonas sp. SORGH_AS_0870]